MRFSPSRQVFIHSHWQGKLQNIGEKLRAYRVQLSLKDAGMEMYVKGTEQGLQEVRKNLEQLGEKVICHEQVCTDQGTVKLLNSNCEKDLKMIGRGSRCVLGLQREPADLQVVQSSHPVAASPGQMGNTANTAASVQLPSGVSVSVMKGDITQMPVDAIVSAANTRMDHVGGLARDIVDKGGDTIQAECYKNLKTRATQLKEGDVLVSGSGRLPCKIIIHAVGPMYKGGRAREEECLYETVMKCMETVNSDGYSSIAIPAISTGICGYPARESTRVIVEAVKAFLDYHRRCTVKNVYFCHVGGDIVQLFTTAVQTTFPSARSTSTAYKPAAVPRKAFTGSTAAVKQTVNNPVQEEATLFVYAENQKDADQALTSLDELVKEKFTRKEITDDFIMSLGPQEELRIQAVAQRHNVEVQIHRFAGRIVGDGMHHNVFDCMQEISNVIREVERKQQQKEAASMLENMVQ
ncbi:protein mono-ADP-ribosyltransferase PARP14-like [Littorina saxatilis]|uniref:protein mono-ADP-ribosyltransferase PARP14-like n=1 Tax=Littorina saxatilis TaxID=31220 RepID=UPI0038B6789B